MPKGGNSNIQKTSAHGITWTHVGDNRSAALSYLRKTYGFHEVDLRDVAPPLQRSKLLARDGYFFVILLFPIFDRGTKKIHTTEVDIFIGPDFIVTINAGNEFAPLHSLFGEVAGSRNVREDFFGRGIAHATHTLFHTQTAAISPMLVHASNDIDAVQKRIETDYERGTIFEILRIKNNVANMIKSLQGHKHVFEKLIAESERQFLLNDTEILFTDLVETSKENWDELDGYRSTVDALHQTNESLISFRVNEIMKALTIFAVIVFPLTLFAAIFSMETPGIPFTNNPHGFWIVVGIMIAGSLFMYEFFRHRKWL